MGGAEFGALPERAGGAFEGADVQILQVLADAVPGNAPETATPMISRSSAPLSVVNAEVIIWLSASAPADSPIFSPRTASDNALAISTAIPATVSDSAPVSSPSTSRGAISRRPYRVCTVS